MSRTHTKHASPSHTCPLCGKDFPERQLVPARALRPSLEAYLAERAGDVWSADAQVCRTCLSRERFQFALDRLGQERGELTAIEREIARKASHHETLAADVEKQFESAASPGQRLADRVASVGGSWPFVASFLLFIVVWAVLNSVLLGRDVFDPYPFILLNLLLSCLAAIQAPIIMMSQNRATARDRMQASEDFRVNLKSELEIASLHEKVDHLLHSQWEHLVELQELQLDLLTELAERKS
ncbi:MAG: DUF1003 domain-containing protein [Planctomycetes bacterium]|nr:DUF1003 domain-containing protein [Planctomycetota bacterium]